MNLLILHINSSFGGAERTTSNLLKHLDRTKIRHITLVSSGSIKKYFSDLSYDRFIDTEPYGIVGGFTNLRNLIRDARLISKIFKQEAPDVILSVMHYPSALLVFSYLLFGVKARKIATLRGPAFEHMKYYEQGLIRRAFLKIVLSITSRYADKIIVPSYGMKKELLRHFWAKEERIEVVPNGIDIYLANKKKNESIDGCEILKNKKFPVLCAASRLSPEKNLTLLLKTFSIVRREVESYLLLVGDGIERGMLEDIAIRLGVGGSVFFIGEKENVFPYIYHSDVYLHSCLFEGFPNVIIEAMACGTPVIATDCPYGPREIIGDNRYGVLVPMNDPDSFATAIISLLKDKDKQKELSYMGIKRAEELSLSKILRRYERVLLTS